MATQTDYENTKTALTTLSNAIGDAEQKEAQVETAQAAVGSAQKALDDATAAATASKTVVQTALDSVVVQAITDGFTINMPQAKTA